MSSGFVPGGTIEKPIERDDEWRKAQQELEEERRAKAELGKQNEGKTLFEVLQANKAAKQDAFEESIRLKNQFRSLDEDEVDFLDNVLESTRAKEKAVKEETAAQLELFRQQREEAQKALEADEASGNAPGAGSPTSEDISWSASNRKRKRAKDKEILKGVKLQKSASRGADQSPQATTTTESRPLDATGPSADSSSKPSAPKAEETSEPQEDTKSAATNATAAKPVVGLGLGVYGSDSDD